MSTSDSSGKLESAKRIAKQLVHDAVDGPDNQDFFEAITWSMNETKKQKSFKAMRNMMKVDVVFSVLVILFTVYIIEADTMTGIRFYNISSLGWLLRGASHMPNLAKTPVYENLRPLCWKTMYDSEYMELPVYQHLLSNLTTEFDHWGEMEGRRRMMSYEELSELTKQWGDKYEWQGNQDQLKVNEGSWFLPQLITPIRAVITVITLVHIILRIKYHMMKFDLYSEQMLFLDERRWQMFTTNYLREMLILAVHLPPIELLNWQITEKSKLYLQLICPFFRIFYSTLKLSENTGRAQLIEFSMKESLLLSRNNGMRFLSNRRNSKLLLVDATILYVLMSYMMFCLERLDGSCMTFSDSLWVIFSACTNLGMLIYNKPYTELGMICIMFWSAIGIAIWAIIIDFVIRMRTLEPESKKVLAATEQKRCRAILRDVAASLIQASWKFHKNRQYVQFHRKQQSIDDTESSTSLHEQNSLIQEYIERSYKNKVWLWKKIKREIKLMEAALQKEVINESVGKTLEEYTNEVSKLEQLSHRACSVMPYPDSAEDWPTFWQQMGKKEEEQEHTEVKHKTMFKKTAWSLISVGVKKSAPNRTMNRRMSTAGFRALQTKASRLSMGTERFAKQSNKLHKNQKIRTHKRKIKIDHMDMGTLHEDEMEQIAEAVEHHKSMEKSTISLTGAPTSVTEQHKNSSRMSSVQMQQRTSKPIVVSDPTTIPKQLQMEDLENKMQMMEKLLIEKLQVIEDITKNLG